AACLRHRTQIVTCQDPFSLVLVGLALQRRLGGALNLQVDGDVIDNAYFLAEQPLYPAFNLLAHHLIRAADTIRVSTSSERHAFVERWGLEEERVWNVPFLVDFAPFLAADP